MPAERHQSLGGNVYVGLRLRLFVSVAQLVEEAGGGVRTSTVSSTFMTPGWRMVRSFLSAFLASGRRDLFALMSKANMLQLEPSS